MIQRDDHCLFRILAAETRLAHVFTTRRFAGDAAVSQEGRAEMTARLLGRFFPGAVAAAWGGQVHGVGVAVVRDGLGGERPEADALVTGEAGVCLVAFGADCPVVFIADGRSGAVGIAHSGRRGTEGGVVTACIETMGREFGTRAADCACAISPSIGPCCYPVDLWARIEGELRSLGARRVENPRACTSCRPGDFFSYRRDRGARGRMAGALMIAAR